MWYHLKSWICAQSLCFNNCETPCISANIIFKIILCLLWIILTLRHKHGVYLVYSSKNLNVLLKIQWIFVISLNLFVIRNFWGTCSPFEVLKRYNGQRKVWEPLFYSMRNWSRRCLVCLRSSKSRRFLFIYSVALSLTNLRFLTWIRQLAFKPLTVLKRIVALS